MKAFDNKTLDMYNQSLELVEVQLKAEIFFLRIYMPSCVPHLEDNTFVKIIEFDKKYQGSQLKLLKTDSQAKRKSSMALCKKENHNSKAYKYEVNTGVGDNHDSFKKCGQARS